MLLLLHASMSTYQEESIELVSLRSYVRILFPLLAIQYSSPKE